MDVTHQAWTDVLSFLFTDVEGSTRLWQESPGAMSSALVRHDEIIERCVSATGGRLIKSGSRGDSALAVFDRAPDAVASAVAIQRAFLRESWPGGLRLAVRVGVHSGVAQARDDDYFGPTLNRAARLHAIAHGGQSIVSSATAELCQGELPAEITLLDLGDHLLKDIPTADRVFQVAAPGLPDTFPPLASVRMSPRGVPREPTSFVGREHEIIQLESLLDSSRLVTLTGVGGTGKTRLAVRVANRNVARYQHGVVFVDLSPVRDPHSVARTFVAAADAVDPAVEAAISDSDVATAALIGHLVRVFTGRQTLLVVDNCEHVVAAAGRVVHELRASCPDLRILATSRQPLALAGEQLLGLPPLRAPVPDDLDDLERLQRVGSVRLFCDRARTVRPSFAVTPTNAAAVAEICRKLDGLPLAIELAAARVNALSAEEIAARLQSVDLLSSVSRDAVDRHRTLERALQWSYDLLEEEERVLLRRVAVFTGGFTLDAADGVCAAPPLRRDGVVLVLSSLIDRSLVATDEVASGIRYRLLEPVRQFAERKLDAAGEARETRNAHREWFVRQAGNEAFMLYTSQERLLELRADLDNFRSAMAWAIETGDAVSGMRIANPLNGVLIWLNQRAESDMWLNKVLAIASDELSELTASTIGTLAANLDLSGDVRRGVALQRQAAEMFEALGQQEPLLWSLIYIGHGLHFCNEYEEGQAVYARAHELAVDLGNKIASSLVPFLRTWYSISEGDAAQSREFIRAVRDIGADGHPGVQLGVQVFEGLVEFVEGRHEAGSKRCDRPIAELLTTFVDATGNEDPMGLWCMNLAGTIEMTQEHTRARGRDRLADLLPRARRTGLLAAFPNPFDSAAAVAGLEGRAVDAAHLLGAVETLRRVSGVDMRYAITQPFVDAGLEVARQELGAERFEEERRRGERIELPGAIDLATEMLGGAA